MTSTAPSTHRLRRHAAQSLLLEEKVARRRPGRMRCPPRQGRVRRTKENGLPQSLRFFAMTVKCESYRSNDTEQGKAITTPAAPSTHCLPTLAAAK